MTDQDFLMTVLFFYQFIFALTQHQSVSIYLHDYYCTMHFWRFCAVDSSLIPSGIIMDRGPQSICVENSNSVATNIANCLVRRCVQIQGSELMAFSLTFNGKVIIAYCKGSHKGFLRLLCVVSCIHASS